MTSPLLDLPGAVAGDGIDAPVAAHYGSFNGEQRTLETGDGFVDLSHRDVVRIERPGPADLAALADHPAPRVAGARASTLPGLILDPQGHVEHAFVGVRRRHAFTAAHRARPGRGAGRVPRADEVHDARRGHRRDRVATPSPGGRARGEAYDRYELVPRDQLDVVRRGRRSRRGLWAFEALRIARGEPRFGLDTDHRTIPNEVGWIGSAVHLDKGCYRGQETVARVHTLGRPPRRLTLLHLDGSENRLPAGRRRPAARREGRSASSAPRPGTTSWARSRWRWSSGTSTSTPSSLVDGMPAAQEVVVDPEVGLHVRPLR